MKIVKNNIKKGEMSVIVTTLDDLWFLSHIIDKSDLITAKTQRKIKIGDKEERKASTIKKTIKLTLEVEKVEFHKYTNALRISGKIIEGPEDIQRGSFHTINIEENSFINIKKEKWLKHQIDKIKEASKEKFPKILICVMDRKEISFALLKRYGFDYISELEGEVQEKAFPDIKKSSTFYSDIIKRIQEYVKRYEIEYIIIASPAFWKEDLLKEVDKKAHELKNKITLATCNATGKNAINEVLKRDEIKKLLKNERIIQEINLVEELFAEISKDNLAVYGLKETKEAASMGAIKILLITDELIHQLRQKEKYEELDSIIKTVESSKGEIHIISTEHEAGQKLQGINGIAAITRYKLY